MKSRLDDMRVFAQVVEAKSFSAAAEQLGMSKSRVSRHVSALEGALSARLLNRSTRRLALTGAGAMYYEHCARIVREAELAEERLTDAQAEPAGLVRITAAPAFAIRHVLPALPAFHQAHPKIQVKVVCSNRTVDLGEERFDLGIRVAAKPAQHLVARRLAPNRSTICAAPAYLERHGTPRRVEDLRKHECVLFPPIAPNGAWTLRSERRRSTVSVTGALETDEIDGVRAAVVAGLGVGILPLYMASEHIRRGELVPLLRAWKPVPETAIYLAYLPDRRLSSRVRAVIDFLVARFRPTPPWEAGL